MTEASTRRRTGGRSARVRQAVLDATVAAVAEHGPDRLSVADVAARAGVHETSIYRRWGTRERLLVDALLRMSELHLPIPDTGSLREDLAAFARSLLAYLDSAVGAAGLRALATQSEDPAILEAREEFWGRRYEIARVMVDRAVARGEVPAGTDPRLALEALIGPLNLRALLTSEPLDASLPDRLAAIVVDGIRADPGGGSEALPET
jgi:AcrR family transcriptional regulator